jgi:hypothetical protein
MIAGTAGPESMAGTQASTRGCPLSPRSGRASSPMLPSMPGRRGDKSWNRTDSKVPSTSLECPSRQRLSLKGILDPAKVVHPPLTPSPAPCSTSAASRLARHAAECQSGSLTVQQRCPERRSNDGQGILESRPDGPRTTSDLVFCVCGATGIRTPDLLHAMNHSPVPRPGHMRPDQARHQLTLAAAGSAEPSLASFCPSICP